MAQNKQKEEKINLDTAASEQAAQDVVDIAKYKQQEEKGASPESSAFQQVMSQMSIADRSAFDKKYAQMWKEASDDNELLSVLICEIDLFKEYHENYGQQGASFMLLVVGLALKNICDKYNCFLAHYQKEEFAILFKGGDEKQALQVAEDLRRAVEESRTEHKFSSVSRVVTLSIGVSSIYPNSMQVLMRKADGALHEAKISGRNQVYGDFPLTSKSSDSLEQKQHSDNIEASHFKQFLLDMNIADSKAFKNNIMKLWPECKAEKELLSLLLCKVDCFQAYRDHCGQQASEDILLITACALQQTCEQLGGFVYHLGEDKFSVLIKGGNATNALRIAESLHKFIAESNTEHKYSEVSDFVTVSIGLSSLFATDSNSIETLIDEAKKALNTAIKAGRNQTSVY